MRKGKIISLIGVSLLLFGYGSARIACTRNEDCPSSNNCLSEGFCMNPYRNGGCLSQKLVSEWQQQQYKHRIRICNSEDDVDSVLNGHCRLQDEGLDYMEIRIITQNWESSFFESWVLQIVLNELLGVPATIETGSPTAHLNFYSPTSAFGYGKGNDFNALKTATNIKDCRLLKRENEHDADSEDYIYTSCGHVLMELWADIHQKTIKKFVQEKTVEPPTTLGGLGVQTWFIPRFTVEKDPTLLSYFGMLGQQNRRKLAETFKRPTTWKDYCDLVSQNNCNENDGVAKRPPQDESEYNRMFVKDLYTGHFRKTEKNDCDKWPLNCTGHIADYPCGMYDSYQNHFCVKKNNPSIFSP